MANNDVRSMWDSQRHTLLAEKKSDVPLIMPHKQSNWPPTLLLLTDIVEVKSIRLQPSIIKKA